MTPATLAGLIDHTLLSAEADGSQHDRLCDEALEYRIHAVCVNPAWVARSVARLQGGPVVVCATVGFPLGATTGPVKTFEARHVLDAGAREVDMVLAIGALKDCAYAHVQREIEDVVTVCGKYHAHCKVIVEAGVLSQQEKIDACRLVVDAGASFVKMSTGFRGGATVADVTVLRHAVGAGVGVKAAGGLRTVADCLAMVQAGATRLGTSHGVAIIREAIEQQARSSRARA